jgi:hypothetical protein
MNPARFPSAPQPDTASGSWRSAVCVGLLAALCSVAHSQTLTYGGSGFVVPLAEPVDNVLSLLATSDAGYTLGGDSGWGLYSPFQFNLTTGLGEGTFSLYRGADRLVGDLDTKLLSGSSTAFELVYTVYGGSGRFAGWTGSGKTTVSLVGPQGANGFPYLETGQLTLVPEPASWALLFAGLGMIAARSRFWV